MPMNVINGEVMAVIKTKNSLSSWSLLGSRKLLVVKNVI